MTADPVRPPRPLSLFPRLALVLLDLAAVLGFLFFLLMAALMVTGHTTPAVVLEGHRLGEFWARAVGTGIALLPALFFWLTHLVLLRSRYGQPFERRNVRLLYVLAGMHPGYVLISSEALVHVTDFLGRLRTGSPLWDGSLSSDRVGQSFVGTGFLTTLTLFAFAAIFQRGTELREEEARLHAEQALTI